MRRLFSTILLVLLSMVFSTVWPAAAQPGVRWDAKYYNNPNLSGSPVLSQQENAIAYDWGTGSPGSGVNSDNFSARWGTDVYFPAGTYRFWALADDQVRVNIGYAFNAQIDTFDTTNVNQLLSADVTLPEGTHHIQVDYRELTGNARVYISWANLATNPTGPNFPAATPPPVEVGTSSWTAQYYANQNLSGSPAAILTEARPNHDWGNGAPVSSVGNDHFSARWTTLQTLAAGRYRVTVRADDGVRVFVNGLSVINEWHGATSQTYTAEMDLGAGQHNFMVEYYEDTGDAFIEFSLTQVTTSAPQPTVVPGGGVSNVPLPATWVATYFNNANLIGAPAAILSDSGPNHDWGFNSPAPSVNADNFSVRWNSSQALSAGNYRVTVSADDGVRVFVNGNLLINEWHAATAQTYTADITLMAGTHTFTVDFYEATERAFINFSLGLVTGSSPTTPGTATGSGSATVTAYRLNVRAQPSTNSDIVTKIDQGQTYPVIGCNGDGTWWQLNINGTHGWVFGSFVNVTNATCNAGTGGGSTAQDTGYTVTARVGVNIRSQPTSGSALLGLLRANQSASVVGRNNNSTWWQIRTDRVTGWVNSAYAPIQAGADINRIPITG